MDFFLNLDKVNTWEIIKSARAATQFSTIYRQQHTLPYQFNEKYIKMIQNNKKNPWVASHLQIIHF